MSPGPAADLEHVGTEVDPVQHFREDGVGQERAPLRAGTHIEMVLVHALNRRQSDEQCRDMVARQAEAYTESIRARLRVLCQRGITSFITYPNARPASGSAKPSEPPVPK